MRQISQEFFNETVQTNMELLDQSVDEAIDETVQSFLIDDVDLSNIIKDMVKYPEGHPCETVAKALNELVEHHPADCTSFRSCAVQMIDLCRVDLAYRKLIADLNVLDALVKLFDLHPIEDYQCSMCLLELTESLLVGQSQILNSKTGEEYLQKIMDCLLLILKGCEPSNLSTEKLNLLSALYKVLRLSCIRNEAKRNFISRSNVLPTTVLFLSRVHLTTDDTTLSPKCAALCKICVFLRGMTMDDDMNVEFGQGSDNARSIASADSAIDAFTKLSAAASTVSNNELLIDTLTTLSCIIMREEFCEQFSKNGGLESTFDALQKHGNSSAVTAACLNLLRVICGSDSCKQAVANWNADNNGGDGSRLTGLQLITGIFERFLKNPTIVKHAAGVVAALALRQPDLAVHLASFEVPDLLVKALEIHMAHSSTVRSICLAIRNLVSRSPELRATFVPEKSADSDPSGIESLLNTAMAKPECADEAKAALRDLGLPVKLRELWSGVSSKKVNKSKD